DRRRNRIRQRSRSNDPQRGGRRTELSLRGGVDRLEANAAIGRAAEPTSKDLNRSCLDESVRDKANGAAGSTSAYGRTVAVTLAGAAAAVGEQLVVGDRDQAVS